MNLAKKNISKPFSIEELDVVLSNLKNNLSQDNDGFINEIFKPPSIGDDLKKSLLLMFNKLKIQQIVHIFLNTANVTTIKKKGSVLNLENQRGIFRLSVIRNIMMRLLYNRKYPVIDENMSNCNIGGRKGRGCRDNIFLINGIIHEVLSSKNKNPVTFQVYDYTQMFDTISLEEAISDLFDVGVKDDTLLLLYEANNSVNMSVKTPYGNSKRKIITNSFLQGDTWGTSMASVQVDQMGQEAMKRGHYYLYKDIVPIGVMGMVDDIMGVSEAGFKSQEMNAFINIKTAEKRLQFGVNKCKTMTVGKNVEEHHQNFLYVDKWVKSYQETVEGETILIENYVGKTKMEQVSQTKYLGQIISNQNNNKANISEIKNKSIGICNKIFTHLESLHLGKYYFECGIIFLNSMLRGSILYSVETYYNLKEDEIRTIEKIEESYMRNLLRTKNGCNLALLYIELGHQPARF